MARLERARLQHRGQARVVRGEDRGYLRDRHRTVADGAADEAIALVGELDAVVLEVDVATCGATTLREIERRLGDRKRVAGVEADADGGAGLLAEGDQLGAAEVLVVLDGEDDAGVRGERRLFRAHGARWP